MWLGPSNQLIQIDTGNALTFLYQPTAGLGAIAAYRGIGENQVLGQRYVGFNNATKTNPSGSPAIYQLVQYLSTSALATADLTTAGAPAPVYWTDNTFTTVTAITTEGIGGTTLGLNFPAGYMMPNTVSISGLTAAQVLGSQMLIQVGGYLPQAWCSGSTAPAIGAWIIPVAGTFSSNSAAAATGQASYKPFGRQLTVRGAITTGLVDVLVDCDLF